MQCIFTSGWKKTLKRYLPGQEAILQLVASLYSPVQFSPLLAGTGFVHVLFLDWVPVPHVALHVVHVDHKLKPPSTDDKNTAINTEYLVVFIKKTKQKNKC